MLQKYPKPKSTIRFIKPKSTIRFTKSKSKIRFTKSKSKIRFYKKQKNKLKNRPFKKKKKWKNWRQFKKIFLFKKRIYFFAKIKWRFNNMRVLWHQLSKMYLPTIKNLTYLWKKKTNSRFFFFLKHLELRISTIILRARFCYKIVNSYNAIKLNLILVNGVIINKIWYLLNILDLIQKRRTLKKKPKKIVKYKPQTKKVVKYKPQTKKVVKYKPQTKKVVKYKSQTKKVKNKLLQINKFKPKLKKQLYIQIRTERFKWRKYHWNKSRFVLWKIRRISHFNMYFSRKQNTILNYLEINYKIPAIIVLKQPFLKELYINRQARLLTKTILKKIYYLY